MSVARKTGRAVNKWSGREWLVVGLLAVIVLAAFWIRVAYQVEHVFAGGEVRFQETDPWCHMRQVDALVHTFPRQNFFDVYGAYPGGNEVAVAPFYDWILALIILIVGLGNPSAELVNQIGAYFPAVLGAMVPLVAYHVGRLLFNRVGGIAAAILVAFAPGQLLIRSLLGYTDHHAMESLLSTLVLLCLLSLLSLGSSPGREPNRLRSEQHIPQVGAVASNRRWLFRAVAAVLALTFYLLSWTGGAIAVGILAAWLCVQLVVNCMLERDTKRLTLLGLMLFAMPLTLVLPYAGKIFGFPLQVQGMSLGLAAVCFLGAMAWGTARLRIRRRWFLVATLAACGLGVLAFRVVAPETFASILWQFTYFSSSGSTIQEAQPLLANGASRLWTEFGPALYVAMVGFVIIVARVGRRGDPQALLMLVWGVAMAAATCKQVRFSYYLGVVVAILAGGVIGLVFAKLWRNAVEPAPPEAQGVRAKSGRAGSKRRGGSGGKTRPSTDVGPRGTRAAPVVGLCLALSIAFMWPTMKLAIASAKSVMVPNEDWIAAMKWLRRNTPEPFGDPDVYYAYYGSSEDCRTLLDSESAYGVLGWWDCGYWITRIGHRVPISNPTQHEAGTVARFMIAQDEATASRIARDCGARYVVLDVELPAWQPTGSNVMMGKFENLVRWTDRDPAEFYEYCYSRDESGMLRQTALYYPEYYRTLISRLYVCRGKAYTPKDVYVAACRDGVGDDGETIKELVSLRRFGSRSEAEAFIASNDSMPYRIVGISPFYPCVSLEAMSDYTLVYQSPTMKGRRSGEEVRYVEIYEFSGNSAAVRSD